ncbi:valine--tRNA ligase [Rhodovulum sp. DZ06]|uniref:valine--tRNA ligase n=1 Tax=Rhodovulum sp. DZ06 TaxID=3425126 RepID=UPI003D33F683
MSMDKSFDLASERDIYQRWESEGRFKAGAGAKPGAESFCIVIPPPNVTGSLHMGHALNNTLQDILVRWKRMQGFDTLWQPGQDHAGIATQMVVERKLAAEGQPSRREMGRDAFTAKVWEWKQESGDTIMNQLKRLGASCDWSRNAFTMSGAPGAPKGEGGNFHDAVLKVFVGLYKDGLIYRDKRLVNWDPHFETAISDLEVEQVEQNGNLWRFRYTLADGVTYKHPIVTEGEGEEAVTRNWTEEDGAPTAWEERDYLVVATTRPETMLGDTGVAVNPEDPRYKDLVGKDVVLPLVGRRIPIVADDYADPTKGTGAVKITPAHDFNDFEVGKRTGLRVINVMDSKAHMLLGSNVDFLEGCDPTPDAMALHGMDRHAARKQVIALAEEQGWLDGIDAEKHMVPHGDRSKVVIEPWLTDQWFVDAKTLAQPALEAVRSGETVFAPKNWEKTYFQWLENIEPWCVSRQLWWGHQIPVWYAPDGTPFCEASEEEALAAAEAHFGEKVELTRDPDVLDTWFSSGLWPFGTLGWPEKTSELERFYQTDVLITGFDIIFFWVARMMMMGMHFMKDDAGKPIPPFHTVYVHALVRDEKGKKMSKSVGNVIDPLDLIDEYGADAVRFTLTSMAAMGRDIKLAVSRVAGYRNFVTKIWNAARFAEMNEAKPVPGFDPASVKLPLNRWIVGETARARVALDEALTAYRYNDAANGLYAHVWGVVCDWYVEFAKPLLMGEDEAAKAETRATLAWAIDQCLVLLHPIMPFVTEALWDQIAERDAPLIHTAWPTYGAELADAEADAATAWTIKLIEEIRSVRAEMNVPAGAKLPLVAVEADAAAEARLAQDLPLIQRLARVEEIQRADAAPRGSAALSVAGATLCLPLAGVIDGAAEKARLDKAVAKLKKEIGGLKGKLSNEKFLAKAPEEVVEENRERLAAAEAECAKLEAAAARAAELV